MVWAARNDLPTSYVFIKKHYCPICGEKLDVIKKSQIVIPGTEGAKKFGFSGLGGAAQFYLNIKFS